jgi:hypothetical protein
MKLTDLTNGSFAIKISAHGNLADVYDLELIDNYIKSTKSIKWDETISFEVTDDVASKAADRFTVHVVNAKPENVSATAANSALCHADGSIVIAHTQTEIAYSIWTDDNKQLTTLTKGTGYSLAISIIKDALKAGENNLVIMGQNLCGNFAVSDPIKITVENPAVDAVVNGKSCLAGQVELSASSFATGTFKWFESSNSIEVISEGASYTTPVIDKTKTYYVMLTTSSGCESDKKEVEAKVVNYDQTIITADGTLLKSSSSENVQWYFNDEIIDGAVTETYSAKSAGKYSTVTNVEGCEVKADYEYLVTAVEKTDELFSAYPNPSSDKIMITVPKSVKSLSGVTIINNAGVRLSMMITKVSDRQIELNIGAIADGFYILNLEFVNSVLSTKIAKISK